MADDARDTDAIGITTAQERRASRRADATAGVKVFERDTFAEQAIQVRRANILRAKGAVITSPLVISEDDEHIRFALRAGRR